MISQLIQFLSQSSDVVNSPESYINDTSPGPFLLITAPHLPLQNDIPALSGHCNHSGRKQIKINTNRVTLRDAAVFSEHS